MVHTMLYKSFSAKNGANNTSRRFSVKERLNISTSEILPCAHIEQLSKTDQHSLGLFTILVGERHHAHLTIVYRKGDLSDNFKSISSTFCLHCPRNFLFFSANAITSFNNALVAAPKSTRPLSKRHSVLFNHFFFSLFMIGAAKDSWQNMSRCSLSKIFSSSAHIKGTTGQSVWNITKYGLKIPATKAKNCNLAGTRRSV